MRFEIGNMTEPLEILAVVSVALAVLALLPRAFRAVRPNRPDPDPRLTWIAALIVALAGALTTHLLAIKRDRDRDHGAQLKRAAHYAELQPLLRKDAVQFDLAIQELSTHGHIAPIEADHPEGVIHDDMFSGQTLASDFSAHFPGYAAERDAVEKLVIAHEAAFRSLRDRVANTVKGQPVSDEERREVANAVVEQCSRSAGGNDPVAAPGAGAESGDGRAGTGSNGSGAPPADLRERAMHDFHADRELAAECDSLKQQADADLPLRLRNLIAQATELSEMTTLAGDCRYLH